MVSVAMNTEEILKESDHYKVFGVKDTASSDEISVSYKNFAKIYHPDRADSSQKDKYTQVFSKITASYNILKDAEKRKNYDYEKKLKEEYDKILAVSQKNFAGPGVVEKSTSKPSTFNLGSALSGKVYNYDNYTSPDKTNTNQPRVNPVTPPKAQQPQPNQKAGEENSVTEKMYSDAMEKFKAGNIDAAILDLQTACVMAKSSKYHSALGLFMKEKGWHGYAQTEFKKALAINPKDKIAIKYMDEYESKKEEIMNKGKEIHQKLASNNQGFIAKIISMIKKIFSK